MTSSFWGSLASGCSMRACGGPDGLGLAAGSAVGEGEATVVEEVLEPVVERVGVGVAFLAGVGNRDLVDEAAFEDGDLLVIGEGTALRAHGEPPFR